MNTQIKILENKMVTFTNLITVKIRENSEPFKKVPETITSRYDKAFDDMSAYFDGKIVLRKTVIEKLLQAQKYLQNKGDQFALCITYGYRSLEIQTSRFTHILQQVSDFFPNPSDVYEEAHRFVAVPTVAGHPTGGAIDIVIINRITGQPIDFGSKQYDYSSKECYVFWPDISEEAKKNRYLLRECLLSFGFSPFDGEWWHFSYGDREWAYYYNEPYAIYSQMSKKEVENMLE